MRVERVHERVRVESAPEQQHCHSNGQFGLYTRALRCLPNTYRQHIEELFFKRLQRY